MTLIDSGVYLPSINPYFNQAQSTNYWTSTPTASTNMLSWTVKFDFGEVIPYLQDTQLPVRCVRGKSTILNVAGEDGGTGLRKAGPLTPTALTVQDTTTGLEWQRTDDGIKRSWKDSLDYCAGLSLGGLSGWHLPNISELLGIVQYDALNSDGVAIDPAFTGAQADLTGPRPRTKERPRCRGASRSTSGWSTASRCRASATRAACATSFPRKSP